MHDTHTPHTSALGHDVAYPSRYDAGLLFPIPRSQGRMALGVDDGEALPFIGHDRWQAFELSWLDARGKPVVEVATFLVPADSPRLIESKSFKLYLNSLNAHRLDDRTALRALVEGDLSRAAGAPVTMAFGVPPLQQDAADATCIDALDIAIDHYGPPNPELLSAVADDVVEEALCSSLLKSNCPVTGQPDWADLSIAYRGQRIDRAGLLRYLVSFRDHSDFHEHCVERIFLDLRTRCRPLHLSVEARYTRRGGLDINPWRATPGLPPPAPTRTIRQ